MANQDLMRMLTGISSGQQSVMQEPIAGSPNFRGQFAAQQNQRVSQGLGRAMRGGEPSAQEKMEMAESKLNLNSVKGLTTLGRLQQLRGDMVGAAKTAAMVQAMKQGAKQREQLIAQATKLNLPETADMLIGGGDVTIATKQILEAEERGILSKQGRKGKLAVAQSKNAGEAVYNGIKNGDYDDISDTLFLEQMKGEKADLKIYQQTVDGRSVSKPFRVNPAGKIWDSTVNKWVNPSEMGLSQAPQITQVLSEANNIAKTLTDGATKNYLELNEAANTASEILILNARSTQIMNEGIKTGFGAEFRLNTARLAKELGLVPKSMDDVAATEEFIAIRARQLMKLLPAFGAGSGISDRDVDIARGIAGGDIKLSEDALRRILAMEELLARDLITKNNTSLGRLQKITGEEMDPSIYEGFYIPMPERAGYATPPNAAKYLNPSQ